MEPENRYYDPFIKPLLDRPDSTYRHTPLSGAHPYSYWDNYRTVMSDPDLLPSRPALSMDDPKRRQLDPSILLIGNLARRYKLRQRSQSVNFSSLILQHMAWAGLTNEMIHTHGLVRMLWWGLEAENSLLFPVTEVARHSINAAFSLGTTINEVVGVVPPDELTDSGLRKIRKRSEVMRALATSNVSRSMREKQMQLPEKRGHFSAKANADSEKAVSPLVPTASTADELRAEVDGAFARLRSLSSVIIPRGKSAPGHDQFLESIEFPQVDPVSKEYPTVGKHVSRVLAIGGDMGLRVVKLEASLKALEDKKEDSASLDTLRHRIRKLDDDFRAWLEAPGRPKEPVEHMLDEQISFFSSPPLLATEAREYEPLQAKDHEFWPRYPMMLLDMVPKTRELSVPDLADAKESVRVCQMLLKTLLEVRAQPLPWALDRLAPNAAQDLIPHVPAITDPRKGGRLNPNNVRTRMLSEAMIDELVKAWIEWPFKPSTLELELASESAAAGGEGTEAADSVLLEQ